MLANKPGPSYIETTLKPKQDLPKKYFIHNIYNNLNIKASKNDYGLDWDNKKSTTFNAIKKLDSTTTIKCSLHDYEWTNEVNVVFDVYSHVSNGCFVLSKINYFYKNQIDWLVSWCLMPLSAQLVITWQPTAICQTSLYHDNSYTNFEPLSNYTISLSYLLKKDLS